jgi:dTDP-4-amino-4,6-dideoxygalactose transaminase
MSSGFSQTELARVWPEWDANEQDALARVLHSGRWSRVLDTDPDDSEAGQAEAELASYLGVHHFLTVASGTAALELALLAMGVSTDDEVVVPACSFVAVPAAVARCGATPVFADVEPDHGGISAASLEERISSRTRAVIVVHPCGMPVDMAAVGAVCRRHDVALIEDGAHAWGSQYEKDSLGALGDIGCFSFVLGKALSCGEGGGLAVQNDQLAERLTALHNPFVLTSARIAPAKLLGTTVRLSNWHAAVLRCQLRRVDSQIERRRENWELLAKLLGTNAPLQAVAPPGRATRWNVYDPPFRYDPERYGGRSKLDLIRALRDRSVPAEPGHFDPVYHWPQLAQTLIRFRNPGCPTADVLGPRRIVIRQHFFLGPPEWMYRLADLIAQLTD